MGVALKASYATIYLERISQATSCLDRAPSSRIIGHVQILSVQRLGHLGQIHDNICIVGAPELHPLSLCASWSTWFRPFTWYCVGGQR
jgi:hypothetical protein